jgi:L-lactate dehydrogenase complex protein LldF
VLDNGRSELLGTVYQQALRCIRCSACLNVCPVYGQVGGHTYQSVYSGPIGSILSPLLQGLANYHELPQASSLCLACRDVCPVRIDLPGLLLELRRDEAEGKPPVAGRAERLAFYFFGSIVTRPRLYRFATRLASYAQRPFARLGYLRKGPFPLSRWTQARDLRAIASRPFHAQWREIKRETHGRSNGNLS